ncbi:MAG: thioredoxin domain-containing protein, partial [Candidatus Woesearchaeota archaeon]
MAEKENKEIKEQKIEEKIEQSDDKQLFTITTQNIWKITTVVLAIIVIALLIQNSKYRGTAQQEGTEIVDGTEDEVVGEPAILDMTISDADYVEGSEDAPVTIIEYSDFQCPYCKRFYEQSLSSIETNYVETGKVKIIFRHFPLSFHQNALTAAEAVECAGEQDKFWEMHDKLFESGSGDGTGLSADDVKG